MIRNVTIVGGGTAGWSTAAILSRNPNLSVTVIDPSSIPIIGVGESTIPHIHSAHEAMGFDILQKSDWLNFVDGTTKLTIEFADFSEKGELWIHPFFDSHRQDHAVLRAMFFFGFDMSNMSQPELVSKYVSAGRAMSRGYITPEKWFLRSDAKESGAFHLDATKYSTLLRQESLKRSNVRHVDMVVKEVVLGESGDVSALLMEDGSKLSADLYVDCSGFKAILAEKVGSTWKDESNNLFVDGAWAVQLPYKKSEIQLRNTTYCHALSSGWVWHVPLQSRVGTGYVFSSSHLNETRAAHEFADHLAQRYGYKESELNMRRVRFRAGYRDQPWTKNVVSIGLSAMFCEPIESTAIATGHLYSIALSNALMNQHVAIESLRNNFNSLNVPLVESILSFAELHYTASRRKDSSFWRDYADKGMRPEHVEMLEVYKRTPISTEKLNDRMSTKILGLKAQLFGALSYKLLFMGYGIHQYRPGKTL